MRGIEWTRFWASVSSAKWQYLLLCAASYCASFFLRAIRWRILLNAEGRFGVGTVFWANMAGYLGNNFLPARGGEVLRSVLISRRSMLSKTYVLTTALSERMMDVIAVVLCASLALLGLEPKPRWISDLSHTLLAGSIAAVIVIAVLPYTAGWIERILARLPLPEKIRAFAVRTIEQILAGLRTFHSSSRLTGFAALTAVIWLCDSLALIAGGWALGLTLPLRVAVLLLTGMALGSSLPSTPGYVGIYQFVAVTILPPFGVLRDDALAYICVVQAMAYLVVLAFGLPGLYRLKGEERAAAAQ